MTSAALTPSSLMVSLECLASAKTEHDCATALVSTAALIQEAVLSGQPQQSFTEALDSCPEALGPQLTAALDRATNFHLLDCGGTLGLWLLPVVVSTDATLPSILPLQRNLNALKMSGCLLQQLGLSAIKANGNRTGWTFIVPALYSDEQIRNTDLGSLVRLPHEAREVVRGESKQLDFTTGVDTGNVGKGVSLYYLPFVAFNPEGLTPTMPMGSAQTMNRMSQWATETLSASLGKDFAVHVASLPQPFTQALSMGERLRMDVQFREMMMNVCVHSGVEPNGLAALVAPTLCVNRTIPSWSA